MDKTPGVFGARRRNAGSGVPVSAAAVSPALFVAQVPTGTSLVNLPRLDRRIGGEGRGLGEAMAGGWGSPPSQHCLDFLCPPSQVLQLQMALDQVERGPGELRGEARRGRPRVPHPWVSPQALEGAGNPRSQVSPALPCRLLVGLSVCPSSLYLCSFQALLQSQASPSISPGFGTRDGTQPGEA